MNQPRLRPKLRVGPASVGRQPQGAPCSSHRLPPSGPAYGGEAPLERIQQSSLFRTHLRRPWAGVRQAAEAVRAHSRAVHQSRQACMVLCARQRQEEATQDHRSLSLGQSVRIGRRRSRKAGEEEHAGRSARRVRRAQGQCCDKRVHSLGDDEESKAREEKDTVARYVEGRRHDSG